MDDNPEIAREAIFEVIENQMRDGTPPETKQTFDRLRGDGYSHEDTMKLIGCVVSTEIFDVLKNKEPFNEKRFVAALHSLPTLPWDENCDPSQPDVTE